MDVAARVGFLRDKAIGEFDVQMTLHHDRLL